MRPDSIRLRSSISLTSRLRRRASLLMSVAYSFISATVQVFVAHHLAEALDAREGRPELVGDDRHELALDLVDALQLGDGLALLLERLGRDQGGGRLVPEQVEQASVVFRELGVCRRRRRSAARRAACRSGSAARPDRPAGPGRGPAPASEVRGLVVVDDDRLRLGERRARPALGPGRNSEELSTSGVCQVWIAQSTKASASQPEKEPLPPPSSVTALWRIDSMTVLVSVWVASSVEARWSASSRSDSRSRDSSSRAVSSAIRSSLATPSIRRTSSPVQARDTSFICTSRTPTSLPPMLIGVASPATAPVRR